MPFNVKELAKMRAIFGGGGAKEEEAVTTALNLANGNQTVLPTAGKVLSSVTIEKPATLLPENIAEGVDIAGIIGTLASGGGGGGGNIKFFFKEWMPTETGGNGDPLVVTHNMGVVPDIAFCRTGSADNAANGSILATLGFSSAFNALAKASGSVPYGMSCYAVYKDYSNGKALSRSDSYWIDTATTYSRSFYNANAETISLGIGLSSLGFDPNKYYQLYLIGGLT